MREIGHAIATELRQLIDYHNVRVYRLIGEDLIPVAMQGQVGEYVDETPEQLQVKFGQGITGWVAEHRVAQNLPDAAQRPAGQTIPGTEDDLDESMLLAPMLVRGPGPRRPRPLEARPPPVQRRRPAAARDLRQLRRPGVGQRRRDRAAPRPVGRARAAAREPARPAPGHRVDPDDARPQRDPRPGRRPPRRTSSATTTSRSRSSTRCPGCSQPLTARGIHADDYLMPWSPGEEGLATWVVDHNEPVLVVDERTDDRGSTTSATARSTAA